MEDLHLGRIAALVPEFAVKDLPLGRTLMIYIYIYNKGLNFIVFSEKGVSCSVLFMSYCLYH